MFTGGFCEGTYKFNHSQISLLRILLNWDFTAINQVAQMYETKAKETGNSSQAFFSDSFVYHHYFYSVFS